MVNVSSLHNLELATQRCFPVPTFYPTGRAPRRGRRSTGVSPAVVTSFLRTQTCNWKSPTALFFYSHPFLVEHFFFPVPTACPLWTDLTPKSCPRQKLLALTNWQSPTICPFNPVSWGNICKSTVNEPFHCVLRFEKVVSSSREFFNLKF